MKAFREGVPPQPDAQIRAFVRQDTASWGTLVAEIYERPKIALLGITTAWNTSQRCSRAHASANIPVRWAGDA